MTTSQRQSSRDDKALVIGGWGYDGDFRYVGSVPAEFLSATIDRGFWVEATQQVLGRETYLDLHLVFDTDRAGRPQLCSMTIRTLDYEEGLTTRDLRAIRLGELYARVCGILERGEKSDWSGLGSQFDPPMPPDDWATELRRTPRPGRRGRDDRWYADLAKAYVDSGSRTPVKDLSEGLNLSASQVRNLLHEARRRGLLTRSAKGKAGGVLTDSAKELLDGSR